MERGHLLCRRRARSRPQGAGAAGTSRQGTSDGRGEAAHSTAHRIREGGTGKHRATEGPRPPQRPSTSRKRRTSRPAVTEHVGDESSFALYRSAAPDSTAGTAAKCVWTGRAQPISSAASARRTGNEMVCTGSANDGDRSERRTPRRLDARRDCCALAAAGTEPAWWWTRLGGLRRQIRGAGASRGGAEGRASAAVSGKTAPGRKRHAETTACAGFWAMRARLPRCRLTRDNGGHGAPDTCADRRNALRAAPGAMGDPAGNALNPKTSETAPPRRRSPPRRRRPPRPTETLDLGNCQTYRGDATLTKPPCAAPRAMAVAKPPCAHRGRWQSRSEASRASSCRTPGGRNGGGWGRIGDARGSGNAQQSVCGPYGWRGPGRAEQPTQQQRVARIFGPLGRTTTGQIDAR